MDEIAIREKIYIIRGRKVMFDKDLAMLYGVPTKRLNEAVKRNIKRFPKDFMFQLNKEESELFLRSQIVTLNKTLENKDKYVIVRKYLQCGVASCALLCVDATCRGKIIL